MNLGRSFGVTAAIAVALLVGACGSAGVPAVRVAATPRAGLEPVVVNSQLVVGRQRLAVGVLFENAPVRDARVHVRAFLNGDLRAEADLPYRNQGLDPVGIYAAEMNLDHEGRWVFEVTASRPDGRKASVPISRQVVTSSKVPTVGQPAPPSRNPTRRDVFDVSYIDSGQPPDDMHELSIAGAIAEHRPTLVVFATPAFCESSTCGPEVHAVQLLEPAYRDRLTFIHVEIYTDFRPDPAKRQLAPTVREWNLESEPWVFLIDARGIIRAAFEGPTATDEIQAAVDAMLSLG